VLYAKVPYDPVRDFVPSRRRPSINTSGHAREFALRGIDDIVAAARARPGAITYGSTGFGGGNTWRVNFLPEDQYPLTHVP